MVELLPYVMVQNLSNMDATGHDQSLWIPRSDFRLSSSDSSSIHRVIWETQRPAEFSW